MIKNNIITGILLIIVVITMVANFNQDAKIKELLRKQRDDITEVLETTQSQLGRSEAVRDSLRLLTDSLLSTSLALRKQLQVKDREIASIKGRYTNVPVDSLAKLMNERWKNAN